jgi:hypothetical protein
MTCSEVWTHTYISWLGTASTDKLGRSPKKQKKTKQGRSTMVLRCFQGKFSRNKTMHTSSVNQSMHSLSTTNNQTETDRCRFAFPGDVAYEKKNRSSIGMMGVLTPLSYPSSYIRGPGRQKSITLWIRRLQGMMWGNTCTHFPCPQPKNS